MHIHTLTEFFKWCTILNGGLFVFTVILLMAAPNWVYRTQSKFFPMPRESFNVMLYGFIGLYKIIIIAGNVVPFIALEIAG